MQTPREVIDSLVRKQPADRVGLMDSPWHDTLKTWARQGYPTNDEGNPVGPAEHFGFDMVGCGGWLPWVAKVGEDELLEETDEWTVRRNGSGAALKYWGHKSGTPEHIDFLMTDRDVWERDYRPHVVGTVRARVEGQLESTRNAVEAHRQGDKWAHYGHMLLWEMMRGSLDTGVTAPQFN